MAVRAWLTGPGIVSGGGFAPSGAAAAGMEVPEQKTRDRAEFSRVRGPSPGFARRIPHHIPRGNMTCQGCDKLCNDLTAAAPR